MGGRRVGLLLILAGAAAGAGPAFAASPAQQLADRYAPIVALQKETKPCARPGEPWTPTAVETVLGNSAVVLRGPGFAKRAPTAADLAGKGTGYYLDLPGDPLDPGCTYERDAKRFQRGRPAVAYARITQERGHVALQYWLYYYFNDFNDKHESDWEGIQLSFDAGTVRDALRAHPAGAAYAQHEGGEVHAWDDSGLQRVGDHPIVYVAAGSHASHFSSGLWLGHSASAGWGCENTHGAVRRVPLKAVLLDMQPWLTFRGRWGQKERGPNNGPQGPNTKSRWTAPLTWQDSLRHGSTRVPKTTTLGRSATIAFCGTVHVLSLAFVYYLQRPGLVILIAVAGLALLLFSLTLTRWRPLSTEPLRARRAGGQMFRAGVRLYWRRKWALTSIGLISVPLGFAAVYIEKGLPSLRVNLSLDFLHVVVNVVAIGAATAVILDRLDHGERIGLRETYSAVRPKVWTLVKAVTVNSVVAGLRVLSVVGIPSFLWGLVGGAMLPQQIVIDGASPRDTLRRFQTTWRNWLRAGTILFVLYAISLAAGPVAGFGVLLFTAASPEVVDLIGSLAYSIMLPYLAVVTTLLYFDLKARREEALEVESVPAPVVG